MAKKGSLKTEFNLFCLGYASCFWGVAPKIRQAQDDTFGVGRDAIEIRPSGGSNTMDRVWNLAKNQSYPVTEPIILSETQGSHDGGSLIVL